MNSKKTASNLVPSVSQFLDIESEIRQLKAQKNAVILAHFYQDSEIQDIADFVGDSLYLSQKAASTDADIILFSGVKFMAEAAKIINPDKTVLLPDLAAGCSLEDSCQPREFKFFKEKYPDHIVVTYINCSAEIKALSDIIVTSTNAEQIINSIPEDKKIIFAPDRHLGKYLINKTGRDMVLWNGSCIVHENFSERELIRLRTNHPSARIIAHPECPESLLNYAEHIGSTSSLINYAQLHDGSEFIVLTEPGIIHQMSIKAPNSTFLDVPSISKGGCASCSECPYMRLNTIEKLYFALRDETPKIELDPNIAKLAKHSLDAMLEISKKSRTVQPA